MAAATLTLWRPPGRGEERPADARASTAFYPLVGLGVGLLPAGALLLPLPGLPRAALALALWVVATRAVHLAGWARCCDAALGPARGGPDEDRLRRLEALDDPRPGVPGTAGVALLLLAKWGALAHAPAFAPLVAAPLGRWGMVHALRTYAPAREQGEEAALAGPVPLWTATWIATAVLGAITFASPDPSRTALAVTLGTAASLVVSAFLVDRFRGVTWPACGAACEAAELVVLWGLMSWG